MHGCTVVELDNMSRKAETVSHSICATHPCNPALLDGPGHPHARTPCPYMRGGAQRQAFSITPLPCFFLPGGRPGKVALKRVPLRHEGGKNIVAFSFSAHSWFLSFLFS